jgi:predicted ABC-type exoprotein transport system permease subunit
MLVRVILLLLLLGGGFYTFITVFKHIDKKQWKTFGKVAFKIAVSVLFAVIVIGACGILSQMTNH